ncbi:uncharacterized protein LOC127291577 [Leptopilina boulardi]|uniref:uncharacterized protein LOC127291577 n=1 Tax=Leptopilina boulardi TaxID=63433 RepID=UPI0021F53424|nr:uncharacterized protein LOC127291577 [Leptopilina boulardi]
MDALELQAALVKLDPATTVTPIGSSVKLMVPHPRIAFTRDIDESDLSTISQNQITTNTTNIIATTTTSSSSNNVSSICNERKSTIDTMNLRKLTNQNHQNSQNPQITKCNVIEVR